jgi:hypothetical protein
VSAGKFHTVFVKNDETIETFGKINPWDVLDGSGAIVVKTKDDVYGQYINSIRLFDHQGTLLVAHSENITTAHPGKTFSVKPGIYKLELMVSNSMARYDFTDLLIDNNESISFTYEYVSSGLIGYQWTVIRSK